MADFFEFEESEIVFSDDSSSNQASNNNDRQSNSRSICVRTSTISRWRKDEQSSVPVNIPGSPNSSSSSSPPSPSPQYEKVDFGGYFFEDDNEMVPPHVIVDRRSSGFDSYEKNVRVKNMIHVRNSILKLTGFLES
ncbi:uncharacterized protein LOC110728831 [Chenopodium quinoa]|uniref:uncharacterized protein LOC110728831 n=1 Tax=Chenopodium quinoa TaxID=63459 RepID=UPI000B770037|nr:uncharacterized protein LOC110728831 [Chenopodium quinoa]